MTVNYKDELNEALVGTGFAWATWSPGDGVTRYRLMRRNADCSCPAYSEEHGVVTVLGKSEAGRVVLAVRAAYHKGQNDNCRWKLLSNYLGNDTGPFTTTEIMDYATENNRENAGDPDWTPFQLIIQEDRIIDVSHQNGTEGFLVAIPWGEEEVQP